MTTSNKINFTPNTMKKNVGIKLLYVFLFIFTILQIACSPRPNIQGKGEAFMQGVWNEDSVAFSDKLKNYTQHHLKFSCDSVYIDFVTHSKINFYEDSCYNNGVWKEYAKGVYAVKGDTLFIGATFTHANYKQKISGCYRIGRYDQGFLIKKRTADSISLQSLSDQREIKLSFKEKVICVQKKL